MIKKTILIIVCGLFFGCETRDDPIIGERYNVGADWGGFSMFKPFRNDYKIISIAFKSDSLFTWGETGQVLDK